MRARTSESQYDHRVFRRLSREIGLRHPRDRSGLHVHDVRHRFAIRKSTPALTLADLDATFIGAFLTDLEVQRLISED
jgi:hypothetical protein